MNDIDYAKFKPHLALSGRVSNRWQRRHFLIQHVALIVAFGGGIFWLQLDLPVYLKGILALVTLIVAVVGGYYLVQNSANAMVRVYPFDSDVAVGVVQRGLTAGYIPFGREYTGSTVHFVIRGTNLALYIEDYPLNLPVDHHIDQTEATLVEVRGVSRTDKQAVLKICQAIDAEVARRVARKSSLRY